MDTLQTILTRRSIRKYQDKPVPSDTVKDLLRAAMSAPSAYNQQPWRFVVIDDRAVLTELSNIDAALASLKGAAACILVCGEPRAAVMECYWMQDCTAATQNILIAAHALGLGAVWHGINPVDPEHGDVIGRIACLPDHIRPFSVIALGYPAETPAPRDQFDEGKIHYQNKW